MEKTINLKIADFINTFKKDLVSTLQNESKEKTIEYIYSYPHLTITKGDTQKRKRVKNSVPFHERCKAKRANEAQCTRRRRDGSKFCGTHIKGTPHGEIVEEETDTIEKKKIQVWAQEISGIIYYLDNAGNVYNPADIFQNKENPKIIAKYRCLETDDTKKYELI